MSHGYYEKIRDDDKSILVQRSKNHTYPAHFHTHLELFLLQKGEYELFLDGKTEKMRGGDIAVIDSFAIHSYQRVTEGQMTASSSFPLTACTVFGKTDAGIALKIPFSTMPHFARSYLLSLTTIF